MRGRWNGGYVGPWQTPSAGSARGIFNAAEMQQLSGASLWPQPANDPYFQYVTALLQGNGGPPTSVSGTNTTNFNADASTNNFQLNLSGDVRNDEFHPYQQGFYSNFFDGTGDYLTIGDNAAFEMTGDFTIETWFCPTSTATDYQAIISKSASGIYAPYIFYYRGTLGTVQFSSSTNGSSYNLANYVSLGSVTLNTWNHIAVSRSGSSVRLFLNGSLITTISNSSALTDNANSVGIGGRSDGTELLTGYISNTRIVKGQGLYTAAFTPSTTPLTTTSQGATASNVSLLTCQSNRIIDNGRGATITRNGDVSVQFFQPFGQTAISTATYTNNQPSPGTNGYYGVYFDGASDWIAVTSSNAAFGLGTGDFTIECWLYPTANPTNGPGTFCDLRTGATNTALAIRVYPTREVAFYDGPAGGDRVFSGVLVIMNSWNHVAVVRSGSTLTCYINGVSAGTSTTTNNFGSSQPCYIGANQTAGYDWNGYISNFRIVKGTAVYTTAFTPSTTPLTAISGTSILACQSSSIIDNSGNNFTMTTNGTPGVTVTQPFTSTVAGGAVVGYGSAYFDGTGDYLTVASNASFGFGTENLTIEFWLYTAAKTQLYPSLVNNMATAAWGANKWAFYDRHNDASTKFTFWVYNYNTTTPVITSTLSPQNNTWYHIALVRSGSTFSLYINGALDTTYTNSNSLDGGSSQPFGIGYSDAASTAYHGYISNLRVVKGTAVYTANFIPPSMPVTAVSNTQLLSLQYNGGASNSGFEDGGPYDLLVNRAGNVSQGTFTPYGTNWSNYFDGSGDYLSFASSTNYSFGTGDFTVECWANFGTTATDRSLVSRYDPAGGWVLRYDGNGISFFNGDTSIITKTFTPTVGVWYHIAVARQGTSMRLFINGVLENTVTNSTSLSSSTTLYIGRLSASVAWEFQGWISNVRIVNGTAVYTSSFLPPTAPLTAITNTSLLTCQSNRLIDNSTNNATVTRTGDVSVQRFSPFRPTVAYNSATYGGSAYFDGTGDYLFNTTQSNAGFNMSSGSWTVEAWVYKTSSAAGSILNLTNNGTTAPGLHFWINSSNQLVQDNGASATTAAGTVLLNTWAHVAAVCNGTNTQLYINGAPVGSVITQLPNAAQYFFVGAYAPGSTPFPGYISDVRVVKGTAIYTGAFTPPTAPLTSTANTSLLLGMANTGQYDNSMMAYWESANNTQSTRSQYKYGTGSLYFDGTADYLTTRYTQGQWFLGDTFTIEAWVYIIARATSDFPIFSQDVAVTGSFAFQALTVNAAGTLAFNVRPTTGGGVTSVGGGTVPVGTWTHCAVSVAAGQARVFLNGTQVGSTTAVTMMAATLPVFVGVAGYGNGYNTGVANSNHLNGYIDDLRVTRGIARYTANFTPPTAQFVNT